jgi:hypothetical protein
METKIPETIPTEDTRAEKTMVFLSSGERRKAKQLILLTPFREKKVSSFTKSL